MIPVAREISDIQGEFEGGTSLAVDWYAKLRLAAEALLDNIFPETLKRRVPIYGGLSANLQVYYCPLDVETPSRLWTPDRRTWLDYRPTEDFYLKKERNVFTIETVNQVRFIVIRTPISVTQLVVDEFNDPTGFTGDVTLVADTFNKLPFSAATLKGTFSDSSYTVGKTLAAPIDMSALTEGLAILPVYLEAGAELAVLTLKLMTDSGNYLAFTSAQDSIGDNIIDGQNMVRFWMQNGTPTGSPDLTNITAFEVNVQMKSGTSQQVNLGRLTVQGNQIFFLDYYSKYLFLDGTTGAWKDTPVKGDYINLGRDEGGIFHFEACRVVTRGGIQERITISKSGSFDTELARKYQAYFLLHPSAAKALTYNIMPDIPIQLAPYYLGDGFDIPDRIGAFANAQPAVPTYIEVVESPTDGNGNPFIFNGTNTDFYLSFAPDPTSSLVVTLNGEILTLGIDYTLSGKMCSFITPPSAVFEGAPFSVRYTRGNYTV